MSARPKRPAPDQPESYEKLGSFYLGREYDLAAGETKDATILYDAKDLTTHGVIVGMTGSGKTGLAVAMLEEAAIDGIPVLAIDPKGDLGNLLLTFPKLAASDFEPWVDEQEAARRGRSVSEEAAATAKLWKDGLAKWGQGPARIRSYAKAAERTLYTPGSSAGTPLRVLRSFDAPPAAVRENGEALAERVQGAVSGLLGLLGIDADPIQSREHILLSNLLAGAWREGRDLDLPGLIRAVQKPPFERIGVLDLESFYPAAERGRLAMTINNLLASPGFEMWTQGEALDIERLLYTEDGRPRIAVLSIAHLSERERMFFVTILLNEVITWMRAQPGSRSLRALLYMDEVFGYLPPTANPPSKTPLLTLLKQARAYGVGCLLATQNPVDLDYKALSNAGTWFLGRLQTERDKQRVLDGLEGASVASGGFDRAAVERTLSAVDSRVFLMNNVHEDAPVLFHVRWVLSYLAGPLSRAQIERLCGRKKRSAATPKPAAAAAPTPAPPEEATPAAARPNLPTGIAERFAAVTEPAGAGEVIRYRPALLGRVVLHHAKANVVDHWREVTFLAELDEQTRRSPFGDASHITSPPALEATPEPGARFATLPSAATRAKTWTRWSKMLETHAYREARLPLWKNRKPKLVSEVDEGEAAFRGRVRAALREERDVKVEKLRRKYAPKLRRLEEQITKAEQRVDVEEQQYKEKRLSTVVSIGTTVLGALFGRKLGSVSKAGTAARRASRAAREKDDIGRAEERVELLRERLASLEANLQDDLAPLQDEIDLEALSIESITVPPRKSDIEVETLELVWLPERAVLA